MTDILIVGIGSLDAGDDAAGRLVARAFQDNNHVSVRELQSPVADLFECWVDYEHVIIIDAVLDDQPPGTLLRFDLNQQCLPVRTGHTSSHGLGLADTIELARVLGHLPQRLICYGIVADPDYTGLHPCSAVNNALDRCVQQVKQELDQFCAKDNHA